MPAAPAEEDTIPQLENGKIITNMHGKQFEVMKKLGEGGFGAVYKMKDVQTDELYAMKTESAQDKVQVLKMEVRDQIRLLADEKVVVLKAAEQILKNGGRHFCKIVARGRYEKVNYVIMTLLGPSLSDLRRRYGESERRFSSSTALRISIQTLEGIEDMHKLGFIHRDVKPANFAVGRPEVPGGLRQLYILDFGLCRHYRKDDGSIRLPRQQANFRGTVRYAPLNCHRQNELSRKDDLETWLYQTIEYTVGSLPWSRLTNKVEVGVAKEAARVEPGRSELIPMPKPCPQEYSFMLDYIDKIQYWEEPDYEFIYSLLKRAISKHRPGVVKMTDPYDWEIPEKDNEKDAEKKKA